MGRTPKIAPELAASIGRASWVYHDLPVKYIVHLMACHWKTAQISVLRAACQLENHCS